MRIMKVTVKNNATDEQAEAAIDLDQIMFANADDDNTMVHSANDVSVLIVMPFEEFLGYWSQDKVVTPNHYAARDKRVMEKLTQSISVEDVIKE